MKLRAWIDYTKTEGYKDYPEDYCILGEMIYSEEIWEKRHVSPAGFYGDSDIDMDIMTFMMCSGIKDKNDKEIYDGDVLEVDDGYKKDTCEVKYGQYKLDDNDGGEYTILGWYVQYAFGNTVWPLSDLQDWLEIPFEIEVVGNIYETIKK